MKQLYILVTCLTLQFAASQTINFPDANFKAKLLSSAVGVVYGSNGAFGIDVNNNGEVEVAEAQLVYSLAISDANISDLTGIAYFTNLRHLQCNNNNLTSLDTSPLVNLVGIDVNYNQLTNLVIANHPLMTNFGCVGNQLQTLDLTGLPLVHSMHVADNLMASLDVSDMPSLMNLNCSDNLLTGLDLRMVPMKYLNCANNNLQTLALRNGSRELPWMLNFSGNPALAYICVDDDEVANIQEMADGYNYSGCHVNTLCSYVDGQAFYTVSGTVRYDLDANGCDNGDLDYPGLAIGLSNGTASGNIFTGTDGSYAVAVQEGVFSFSPTLAHPEYFTVSPDSATIVFPESGAVISQDFCVTAAGIFPDLKIVDPYGWNQYVLSPGNTQLFSLIYTNQGTEVQSGTIQLAYDSSLLDFVGSVPSNPVAAANQLSWSFTNLQPFESREIQYTLRLHAEGEIPGPTEGQLLNFSIALNTAETDQSPGDNALAFEGLVTNVVLANPRHDFSDYFSLFPNPTHDWLNVRLKDEIGVKSIAVYNLLGQRVAFLPGFIGQVDTTHLRPGIYLLRIDSDKGLFATRFIRE